VAKKDEVAGLPGPDKQQNAEMKSVVAATNNRKSAIPAETGNKLFNNTNWKIREIKMQQIFYIRKSRN